MQVNVGPAYFAGQGFEEDSSGQKTSVGMVMQLERCVRRFHPDGLGIFHNALLITVRLTPARPMYERHFGFQEKPFNLTPDTRYLFLSPKHQEAFANLQFGVKERSGFLLLTGEVGTGKTTLIRHFLSQVGPDVRTAVILYPALSAGELFHAILQDLEIPFNGGSLKDAVDAISNALIVAKGRDLKVVVLVDEAQNLQPRVLEQLRLLSNLETEREKLLTLVLVGQPELRDLLDQPSLRQLSQRITSRSHLEPLTLEETRSYIRHRLVVAGGSGGEITDGAMRRVHEFSGGVPRVVNVLCDRALVGAFGRGEKQVGETLVEAAADEVLSPGEARSRRIWSRWPEALGLFVLGLVIMLALRACAGVPKAPVSTAAPTTSPAASATAPLARVTPIATEVDPATVAHQSVAVSPAPTPTSVTSSPTPLPVVATQTTTAAVVRCTSSSGSRTAAIAAVEGFLKTPGFDTAQTAITFDQWQALKLPAIARFRGASGECEAALLPMDDTSTTVANETGSYAMANNQLRAAYLGSAILCFVDRDSVLAKSESARMIWARRVLERKSLIAPGASDQTLKAVLSRIGARVQLKSAASVDGPLLAALYALEGGSSR